MATYILRRLLLMIPTLLGITLLVFMIVAMAPGGIGAAVTAQAAENRKSQSNVAAQKAYLEDRYGLDASPITQYVRWLARILPVKFGPRDLVTPTGDLVKWPKAIDPPPLWGWFAPGGALPAPAALAPIKVDVPPDAKDPKREERLETFKAVQRRASEARYAYIGAVSDLRGTMGEYAKAEGIADAVAPDGQGREARLATHQPNHASPAWPALAKAGERALAAYAETTAASAALREAFKDAPYESAGYAIIPGALSVAAPDFGESFVRHRPVMTIIGEQLPVTLLLNLIATPIIYFIAIPSGILAAVRRGTWVDALSGAIYIALYSIPVVLAGVLCIGYLASKNYLHWFPTSGLHLDDAGNMPFLPMRLADGSWSPGYLVDGLWHVGLPVLCLVYGGFAVLSKQTRAAMLENLSADYVRTAKAKGVPAGRIITRHVLRNSLLPLITLFVTIFPAMLAGSVVIERIFTIKGMGSLVLEAIDQRDRELLLVTTLMVGAVNLLSILLADILYAFADPRISYE